MKAESMKHLQKMHSMCKEDMGYFKELIEAIIRIESETNGKGKFKIWDYVGKDKIRPAMEGVYHDGGFKVATDSYMLITLKEEYDPELERRLMRKDGTLMDPETRYPKWRDVIPNPELEEMTSVVLDFAKIREIEADFKVKKKLRDVLGYIKVNEMYTFKLPLFLKMVRFMEHIGTNELLVVKDRRTAALAISGENRGILMPVYTDPDMEYQLVYSLYL